MSVPLRSTQRAPSTDVLNTVVFSTWCGAPLFAESNQVKRISLNSFNLGKQHGVGVVDGVVSVRSGWHGIKAAR